MVRLLFFQPQIPPNTGNAIRLSAVTGCELHLVEPLGFNLSDAQLRRAGLDYHDLADMKVHSDLDAALDHLLAPTGDEPGAEPPRVFAFTVHTERSFADVQYRPGDVLLFGPEPTGLPPEVLADPRITDRLRIPMIPARRSLNLGNAAALAVYEAWRQNGYEGAR